MFNLKLRPFIFNNSQIPAFAGMTRESMYTPQNFDHLLGTPGFSDNALKTHFTLYQGYVNNANKLIDTIKKLDVTTPEYAELKRRFGWEFNGMRVHELYFGNMKNGGSMLDPKSALAKKIVADFGSFEAWLKDYKATGMIRGFGWAILYHDKVADRLFNVWVNEHDLGHLAGCTPLLAMDVLEHAFFIDYLTKRADYIEAFVKAIDWTVVEERVG